MYGKHHSEETKRKISLANLGKTSWNEGLTKETSEGLRRVSEFQKGRIVLESTRKKISKKISEINWGANNPNWRGGLSFEPYDKTFNSKLKEKIRERDNYLCQECGKGQEKLKNKLSTHHIDYNKKNSNPHNLISLCRKCHLKTNSHRKHWEEHFKMKMFIRGLFNPQNILIFNENKQLIGVNRI